MIKIFEQNNARAFYVCNAMKEGIRKMGDAPVMDTMPSTNYSQWNIFYGQSQGGKELLQLSVSNKKHALYIDMGYWNRKPKHNAYAGHHKISYNALHPEEQLSWDVDDKRIKALGLSPTTKRRGKYILLAGLNIKAAMINGYDPYEWERKTIEKIRKVTDRPIIYRPKPSWKRARPIPGTTFSHNKEPLENVLERTHCVVTRHSNVSIDAMMVGIPFYTEFGAAKELSLTSLDELDSAAPPDTDAVYDMLCKISYCQWNTDEMKNGIAWKWYRDNVNG